LACPVRMKLSSLTISCAKIIPSFKKVKCNANLQALSNTLLKQMNTILGLILLLISRLSTVEVLLFHFTVTKVVMGESLNYDWTNFP